MKKILLTAFIMSTAFGSFAQVRLNAPNVNVNTRVTKAPLQKGLENHAPYATAPFVGGTDPIPVEQTRGAETTIGTTTYDNLPSNQRLFPGPNNSLAATWTGSTWSGTVDSAAWPDRGTFYNFYNGSTWGPQPTTRIENKRSGFPSNVILGNGGEWICSHIPTDTVLGLSKRSAAGTGSFTFSGPSNLEVMWPHATAWGNNIHVIGARNKTPSNQYVKYSRSTDGGQTWDIVDQKLPLIDSADCIYAMQPDNYVIDARGNDVAIVGGGSNNGVYLWKSTDNGSNWNRTVIWNFPMCGMDGHKITDYNTDGTIDTIQTSDGSYAMLMDNNGIVHAWFGYTKVLDNDASADGWLYYPGYNALLYWNETFGADSFKVVGQSLDLDESGGLEVGNDIPNYGISLCSMPTAAIDTTNNAIYVVFSAAVENTDFLGNPSDPAAQSFRDLYGAYTLDGGITWSSDTISREANLTNSADDQLENVFPAASKYVRNGAVDVTWMQDAEPGNSLDDSQANPDPVVSNNIKFRSFAVAEFTGIKKPSAKTEEAVKVYPNPSNGNFNVSVKNLNDKKATISIVNMMGQTVKTMNVTSTNNVKVNATDLASGMYFVKVQTENKVMTSKISVTGK